MRESNYTHLTRHWAQVTACGKRLADVVYSSHFAKMVNCPACKAAMRMTSQWPIGDDGDPGDVEWTCSCSCGQCGPLNLHDCGRPACNSGWYEKVIPEKP